MLDGTHALSTLEDTAVLLTLHLKVVIASSREHLIPSLAVPRELAMSWDLETHSSDVLQELLVEAPQTLSLGNSPNDWWLWLGGFVFVPGSTTVWACRERS